MELMEIELTSRTLTKFAFIVTLALCFWTHPRYYGARVARLFRVPLGILSATWWLCYPFVFVLRPLETNFRANLVCFAICYILLTKTLDWSLFSGPQPRRKFVKANPYPITGIWQVAEKKCTTTLDEFNALLGHVIFQFTSMRGLQYSWGHFSEINRNSLKVDFLRFLALQTYSLIIIGNFSNLQDFGFKTIQDETKKFESTLISLSFVVQHWKNTVMIITGLCTTFEAFQSFLAVLAHLLHPRLIRLGFPDEFCEFFDPVYYPPLFGNPLQINSLSEFWGKTWHQGLRRSFIVLGAFPLGGLAAAMGFSPKHQRTMGFVGAFVASGLVHAGPFFFMSDPNTSSGKIPNIEKLAVFLCFFSQALGALIEEKVIRFIPKWLGGGKLWTIGFLSLTLSVFSHLAAKPGRFTNVFQ